VEARCHAQHAYRQRVLSTRKMDMDATETGVFLQREVLASSWYIPFSVVLATARADSRPISRRILTYDYTHELRLNCGRYRWTCLELPLS
jgi:hypothetical protein